MRDEHTKMQIVKQKNMFKNIQTNRNVQKNVQKRKNYKQKCKKGYTLTALLKSDNLKPHQTLDTYFARKVL